MKGHHMENGNALKLSMFDQSPKASLVSRGTLAAALMILYVGAISAYDGYLVIKTGEGIRDLERNPIGRYLIQLNDGDPAVFLRAKAAGTIVVLASLSFLHLRSKRLALPAELALVVFQTGLLVYLHNF